MSNTPFSPLLCYLYPPQQAERTRVGLRLIVFADALRVRLVPEILQHCVLHGDEGRYRCSKRAAKMPIGRIFNVKTNQIVGKSV